ncbi:hypothetical protein DL96DRAFT_1581633 [Flagelloscypha sp. PMI_526]|nr:hypothetical protein DL96DRAFT_1581633 [Flagelloscypha sp. PMI_526]
MASASIHPFPDEIFGLFCFYLPKSSLKQCCLTSQTFRHFSRPLLFEDLTIQNSPGEKKPGRDAFKFWNALTADPGIGTLVKSLTLLHTDAKRANHWLPFFELESKALFIMTHLPNLITFRIARHSPPPPWGSELRWSVGGWPKIQSAIQHILNLPTLKNFHFYEQYSFKEPDIMRQLFRLTRPSGIHSLQLCGSKFLEEDNPSKSLVPAICQAKIEHLRLYYLHQNPKGGLRLISSLTSPASSFDVTNLSSLELWAVGVQDETWIPSILNAQKNEFTLRHLGLFAVEGYPKKESFIQSLSRFTSIQKFTISEANSPIFEYDALEVEGIEFGFAAAWLSALPANITSTVEEIDIHIETGQHWTRGLLHGMDELLSSSSLNAMKKVVLRVEENDPVFDVEEFLRTEVHTEDNDELSRPPEPLSLREWIGSFVLPNTYREGKVDVEYERLERGSILQTIQKSESFNLPRREHKLLKIKALWRRMSTP